MVRGKDYIELNEAINVLLSKKEPELIGVFAVKRPRRRSSDEQIYESTCSTMGESV